MSNNFYEQIKLGYEYEVLIKCNANTILNDLYRIEDEVQKYSCYDFGVKGGKRNTDRFRDEYVQRVIRYKLAELFLRTQADLWKKIQYNFKTCDRYLANMCDLPIGNKDSDQNSWQVQHDGSVRLNQNERIFTRPYQSLENVMTNREQKSIKSDRSVFENIEIVSPILTIKNNDYIDKITAIYTNIFRDGDLKFFNNSTTSNHIHFSCQDYFRNPRHLYNICINWWHFEPLFMNFCPYWRRNNEYCKTMHYHMTSTFNKNDKFKALFFGNDIDKFDNVNRIIDIYQGDSKNKSTRYASMNLMNLVDGGIGTIEIRIKHGSTDFNELLMFIKLFAKFFDASLRGQRISSTDFDSLSVVYYAQGGDTIALEKSFQILFDKILDDPGSELKKYFYNQYQLIKNFDSSRYNTAIDMNINIQGGNNTKMTNSSLQKYYLFSYGSNSYHQINERTGSHIKKSKLGTLHGYVRVFAGKSARWDNGGIASIYPLKNGKVNGSVIKLTIEQLERLDQFEYGYERKMIDIEINNETVSCYAYFKHHLEFVSPPSLLYLNAIRANLDCTDSKIKKKITVRILDPKTRKLKILGYY